GPAASAVILPELHSDNVQFANISAAVGAGLQVRLFGKPEIQGKRRLGVVLATGSDIEDALQRATTAVARVTVSGWFCPALSGVNQIFAPDTACS
ncbi:hypothetical protein LXA10_17935, partial [Erwinia amylovora]|nr:hypothetical protein [Erwinia amylovora]